MSKIRTQIQASAIASYMGVGFNTPQEQLEIDLGLRQPIFSRDQRERMRVGTMLEDSILDFFEHKDWIGEPIVDRNTERRVGFDGRVSYMIDGKTSNAIVDAKFSVSQQSFIFNKGYEIQGNVYMHCEEMDEFYLIGFDNGTPVWRKFKKDPELIADIEKVVENVHMILIGLLPPEDLDLSIADKYSGVPEGVMEDFDEESDLELLREAAELKEEIKKLEDREKEITAYFRDKYSYVDFSKEDEESEGLLTLKVTPMKGRKTFKKELLLVDYPEMDISKYETVGKDSKRLTINLKKATN